LTDTVDILMTYPPDSAAAVAADGWPVIAKAIREAAGLISVSITGADL
jgi:hypothetical protein